MNNETVVIVGGGAAGLMAAYALTKKDKKVYIFDKNKFPARKVRITGKGRCNITNIADMDEIMENIPRNNRFLYSAFSAFSNYDVMAFMDEMGVSVKVERGGRVFPESDNANHVAEALYKAAISNGAEYITSAVKDIEKTGDKLFKVTHEKGEIIANSVILATGGKSYPLTGSDGSGYKLARKLGHTIVTPKPSLVPLITKESYVSDLMGLSLKNVAIKVTDKGKTVFSDFGEMLFTHFGVSGPLVLSASSNLVISDFSDTRLIIDLKPALDEKQLDLRVLRDFQEAGKKHLINSLDKLLPKALIPVIIEIAGIEPHKIVTNITKEERQNLLFAIKNLTLTITGTRPIDEAIITSGGVSTKEINPSTMESKLCPGLFFAGEVIDVDAYTGGFNLQIAFSTGYLAGENA